MSAELINSSHLNSYLSDSRSMSFAVDPWSVVSFDTVDDTRRSLLPSHAIDEEMITKGVTASNVLVGMDLPEIYNTAYIHAGPVGDRVSVDALQVIIGLGGLSQRVFEQISALTVPTNAMYITRNEFNTALALLAFAQKNMELSLVTVYQQRKNLPVPSLSNLDQVVLKPTNPLMVSTKSKEQVFEEDPWKFSSNSMENMAHNASIKNSASMNEIHTSDALIPSTAVDIVTDKVSTQALVKASIESYQWFLDLDLIKVAEAEKEGFLFTHINYWVTSTQRQSIVRRRYSDFFWLWETLFHRYPFRVIPTLPPKKITGKDKSFLTYRVQGLSRFMNCIARHPILKNDEYVVQFLTEKSDFHAWRRSKSPNLNEEFDRANPQTNELEAFIPKDLDVRLDYVQKRLPKSIETYGHLCAIMEHIVQLKEARALQLRKYNKALMDLRKIEHKCFVSNCEACTQVLCGYENIGKHLNQASDIIETEVDSAIAGVLENLKRHRDILIAFLEMLDRKSKAEPNQISFLYKKISANTAKLNQHRGVHGQESEVERLSALIKADTEIMIHQQRRDTYIKYCTASELTYLHKQQAFVSILYQNFVHGQLQYNHRTTDNWKALEALLCNLPKAEDFV